MKLSAPIYQLKRNAKQLARDEGLGLHVALERIAIGEGFKSWSLLARNYASSSPAAKLYAGLKHGELVLIGARPGQGKTLLALELAAEAVRAGQRGVFFTLEYTQDDVLERLESIGLSEAEVGTAFEFDCSDDICADYIIDKMQSAASGTLIVIDYLQLLDQKRSHAPLAEQVAALESFARERGTVIVFVSQIARSYVPAEGSTPSLSDIRLPNPMDLALFTKTCFLNNGEIHIQAAH